MFAYIIIAMSFVKPFPEMDDLTQGPTSVPSTSNERKSPPMQEELSSLLPPSPPSRTQDHDGVTESVPTSEDKPNIYISDIPNRLPEVIPMDSLSLDSEYPEGHKGYRLYYSYIDRNSTRQEITRFLYIFSLTYIVICNRDDFESIDSKYPRSNEMAYPPITSVPLKNALCYAGNIITKGIHKKWKVERHLAEIKEEFQSIERTLDELAIRIAQLNNIHAKRYKLYKAYTILLQLMEIPNIPIEKITRQKNEIFILTNKPVGNAKNERRVLFDNIQNIENGLLSAKAQRNILNDRLQLLLKELSDYEANDEEIVRKIADAISWFINHLSTPISQDNMYNIQIGYYTDSPTDNFEIAKGKVPLLQGFMFMHNPESWVRSQLPSNSLRYKERVSLLKPFGLYWINEGGLIKENYNMISDKYEKFINDIADTFPNKTLWYQITYRGRNTRRRGGKTVNKNKRNKRGDSSNKKIKRTMNKKQTQRRISKTK